MNQSIFPTGAIGAAARQILAEAGRGVVIGLSSRGAFLRLESSRIDDVGQTPSRLVFLSREPFRGPLTVNLDPEISENLSLAHGDSFAVRDGVITFARSGFQVRIDETPVWSAPPRPEVILPAQERQALFERVSRQIPAGREMPDLGPLSGAQRTSFALAGRRPARRSVGGGEGDPDPAVVGTTSWAGGPPGAPSAYELKVSFRAQRGTPVALARGIPHSVRDDSPSTAITGDCPGLISHRVQAPTVLVEHLVSRLGRGPGLTPAGDDLVLGFLLALARWGDALCPALPVDQLAPPLIEAARKTTTALSAQLIECAAQGQADERLISALDGLISGEPGEAAILESLLDWGHTSGAAALRGLGLYLELNLLPPAVIP